MMPAYVDVDVMMASVAFISMFLPADEAVDGMAALISPVSESANFWNWVNDNSQAACVSLVNDTRTGKPANRLLLEYRSAIEEMVTVIGMTDYVQRNDSVRTTRAKLEKALLGQFIQAVLVKAQQAAADKPTDAGTCYATCWKTANVVSTVKSRMTACAWTESGHKIPCRSI